MRRGAVSLPRWLGWPAVVLLLSALVARLAMPTLSATDAPRETSRLPAAPRAALPPLPPTAWLDAPAVAPPSREATRLPLAIVGSLRHPEAERTILVLETPEGQRVVGEGDPITDAITLKAITPDGLILDHRGRQEHLAWPAPPPAAAGNPIIPSPPSTLDTE